MKSPDIYSLVQHIELNKKGWLIAGIKAIIKHVFGSQNNISMTKIELKNIFENIGELYVNDADFIKAMNELVQNQELVETKPEFFKLSPEECSNYKESLNNFKLIESETKKYFINSLRELLPDTIHVNLEEIWVDFFTLLITPLISKTGAKSFEIITGKSREIDYDNSNEFFKKYHYLHNYIQNLILNFFSNKNEFVKKYLLNLLKTYYFIEASHLPVESINRIYELSKVQSSLKIYVDTNFLLSLLDLHDNPSNDAATSLKELLNDVKNKITVKFYVFPITLQEFKNLILKYKDYIKRTPLLLSHARTLIERDEISGVAKKYYQKCLDIKSEINVDDYFDPYLTNLTVTLRRYGLELQNERLDDYSAANNMSVNDDILAQVEHRIQKLKLEEVTFTAEEIEYKKVNIEQKFKHDCMLWHAVYDKRPEYIDSVKDIKNWILTLDFQFLSYDRFKTKQLNKDISLCLHPNDLISLLYFWVPRTQKFENAVLENFKLPFTFKEFDKKAEEISISILSALSYYENSEDLDQSTITELLTNQALRNKINSNNSIEENALIIKDEIFDKYIQKKKEISQKEGENLELRDHIQKVEARLEDLNRNIVQLIEQQIDSRRLQTIKELEIRKDYLSQQITQKEVELEELHEMLKKALHETDIECKKISNLFKSKESIKKMVFNRFPMLNKIDIVENTLNDLKTEFSNCDIKVSENTIFICENKNAIYFNDLLFKMIKFVPESNSASVFIKTTSNPTFFGIRDRDFLTDSEIEELKKKFPQYKILKYYCFENYLYHPDNLLSMELPNFDSQGYINEILKQVKIKRDEIILNLKNSRKSYQEFKSSVNGINENKSALTEIINCLDSNDIELVLKYFSLKDFDKSFLNEFNLKPKKMIRTEWFIGQIKSIMEI